MIRRRLLTLGMIAFMGFGLVGCKQDIKQEVIVVENQKDMVTLNGHTIELNYDCLEINKDNNTITYQITCYYDNHFFGITPLTTVDVDEMRYTFSYTDASNVIWYVICNWNWDSTIENYELNIQTQYDDSYKVQEEQEKAKEAWEEYLDVIENAY